MAAPSLRAVLKSCAQVRLAGITGHPVKEGEPYACAVKDLWSDRVVGLAVSERTTSCLAVGALGDTVGRRGGGGAGRTVRPGRGSRFRSGHFVQALSRHGLRGSVGGVGACGGRAAVESFFSLLQKNVLNQRVRGSRQQLCTAITVWTGRAYHRRRAQVRLGRLTPPTDYETIMTPMLTRTA